MDESWVVGLDIDVGVDGGLGMVGVFVLGVSGVLGLGGEVGFWVGGVVFDVDVEKGGYDLGDYVIEVLLGNFVFEDGLGECVVLVWVVGGWWGGRGIYYVVWYCYIEFWEGWVKGVVLCFLVGYYCFFY